MKDINKVEEREMELEQDMMGISEEAEEETMLNEIEKTEEDPNTPIFEGGPTISMLDEWKKQYKQLYFTEIDIEDAYIWRSLNRKEYKELMKMNEDELFKEEKICEWCVLWPKTDNIELIQNGKAGTPTVLAQQIMEKSGFALTQGPIDI